jgi:hypothetical protein
MLSNVLNVSQIGVEGRAERRVTTAVLAVALLGMAYPLTPPLLFSLAAATTHPLSHGLAIVGGTFLVFAIPLVGALLVGRSAGHNDVGALRARGVGMLLVTSPVLAAMIRSVASVFGAGATGFLPIWIGFWMLATTVVLWRSTIPRSILSSRASRGTRRVHRMFIVLLIAFAIAHLMINLTALEGLAFYNQAAGWFRLLWRTPVAEPILVSLLAMQLVSGMLLAFDASAGRSTVDHLAQITAGLLLGSFLVSHTTAVAVLGRTILDHGPAFTFASAGPNGLLGSTQGAELYPYYGLAVVALLVHLARPLRLWMQRTVGASPARFAAVALVGTGVVVSALLLIALLNPMR